MSKTVAGAARGHPPLLRQRDFAALWSGQLISIIGDRLNYLALLGLLAEYTQQFRAPGSSLLLTLLANFMLAPVLLFSPITGAWLDRQNLKRVLVTSDVLRALVVSLIPVLFVTGHHIAPVFVLVFVLFTCNVFFLPAKSAITPEIVPPDQLLAANALLSGAGIAATAVGALAGGWIVDHWGWKTALWMDAATYLVSVGTLLLIGYRPEARREDLPRFTLHGYFESVVEGWNVVRQSPAVGLGMMVLGAVWVGGGFLHVAGNQHIQRAASVPGMERVGVLLCTLGLGSGIGTWWMNHYARRTPRPLLLGVGLLLTGLALAAIAFSSRFAVYAIGAFVIGMSVAPVFVLSETLIQQGTELKTRGRVFSARDFIMRLVFLIGVTLAGTVTRASGTRAALLVCAGIVAVAGLWSVLWTRGDHLLQTRA